MAYQNQQRKEKQIAKMHHAKMKQWEKRELGMQIGAAMNKAVDIACSKTYNSDEEMKEDIIEFRDWILEEQTKKMDELLHQKEDTTDIPTE